MRRGLLTSLAWAALCAAPAAAGPPYITDDPEPTDTGHFENYLYIEGTRAGGEFAGPPAGIEVNYGAFADTQLTASVPLNPNSGLGGMGIVWAPLGLGLKYRFIEEDESGWRPQVAFFPQISIPVGSASHTSPATELFPVWMQKSSGAWTVFGGGGFTNNPGTGNRGFLTYGGAVTNQVADRLQLGIELFGQSRSADTSGSAVAAGFGWIFDFNDEWHLVGSVNRALRHVQADEIGFNIAVKWTI